MPPLSIYVLRRVTSCFPFTCIRALIAIVVEFLILLTAVLCVSSQCVCVCFATNVFALNRLAHTATAAGVCLSRVSFAALLLKLQFTLLLLPTLQMRA